MTYKTLDGYLKGLKKDRHRKDAPHGSRPARVYLIYGEEVLCKAASKKLLDTLVPADRHRFNYEPVDEATGGVYEAIEKLNTFSLLSGPKVVGLLHPRLFDSGPDAGRLLRSARQAHDAGNMSRAAADLLRFMALASLSFDDLSGANRRQNLPVAAGPLDDDGWLDDILAFCRANGHVVPPPADSDSALCRALEKGFPAGNHLLITTDTVDKRKKLFKMIRELGVLVDCCVPTGNRKSDKQIQEAVLLEAMNAVLAGSGKSIDRDAFTALQEMTGFDIRAFTGNVEKLVDFVGDRPQITRADIAAALQRTKKDPVYALTGAVAARNLDDALFYLSTLMAEGLDAMRPEQILVAILNQIRKLLRVKEFTTGSHGSVWFSGCPYNRFTAAVMPVVQQFDAGLLERKQQWQDQLSGADLDQDPSSPKKGGKKKKQPATDLSIVKNPNNPYPVYQLFLSAENYTKQELVQAFDHLSRADLRIKKSGDNRRLILEEVIIGICKHAR
ncbi:MAG: DNA polymerase III subunit delta [Desulfobacterales bacterium]